MLHRAYSTIEIKGVDDERRVITGIATTPTPDRVGDIVEPLGIAFHNPLPFLLHHDGKLPVGEVVFDPPTKAGIRFTATLPKVIEAGTVRDRVDEAWHSAKYKLLRGVSIGFLPLEKAFNKATNGYRLIRSEIVELSFVAIPMNVEATVHTVKSHSDLAQRAIGTARPVPSRISPAVVGVRTKDAHMDPIADRITAALADLKVKTARLEALEEQDGADGGLDDAAEITERDGLTEAVTTLSSRVKRLKALELAQAEQAAHVVVRTRTENTREVETTRVQFTKAQELPPGIEFARYIICRGAAMITGASSLDIAKSRYPDHPRIQMLIKEAVAGASTQDATNAAPLVYAQNLVSEFVDFLRPQTILGRIGGMTRVPFNVSITGQTSGGAGYWVGEGRAKPLTSFNYNRVNLGWAKVASISVILDELMRFSSPSAEALVRDGLVSALRERLDVDFINPAKSVSANVSPASITNGLTPLVSSGNDVDAVDADVQAMFTAFLNANITPTTGVWIMPNTVALALSLMRTALGNRAFPDITMTGGTFYGLPVIASQYAVFGTPTRNMVVLANAADIFLADDGGFSIDVSREASLEMDDAPVSSAGPLGSPGGAVGTALVSMFQTNSMAIRAERFINWARRRDTGVVFTDDVNWAPGGASV